MKQTEKIRKQWESDGYFVINLIVTNKKGIPDYIALKENERPVFIESKEKNDTVKPLQKYMHKVLLKLGFRVFINEKECTTTTHT